MNKNQSFAKAYSSQLQEITLENVRYEGTIPKWLKGSFINNGPTQFEIGNSHFNHWFDGFAMLKKFHFIDGKVTFQNRFLHSQQYVNSKALNKLSEDEFGTYANGSWLKKIFHALTAPANKQPYDNCNVNTTRIGNNYVAMTESNEIIAFNLTDLKTLGSFHFEENLPAQISLAHPHLDNQTGEIFNIGMEIGKTCQYHVFKIEPGTLRRQILQTIHCDDFFYMHSFTLTPNYVILFKTPLHISKWKILLGLTIAQSFTWQKKNSSYFILINRNNGQITEIETNPFVCLHSINGFEKGNEIILDLVCYDNGNPYDNFYLKNLRSEHPEYQSSITKRFILNTSSKQCHVETFNNNCVEFPRIYYKKKNGLDYQYVYTTLLTNQTIPYSDAIQKLNVHTGATTIWQKSDYYPEEPVFIPQDNASIEDEGVLMFIAHNAVKQLSSLIILNAPTLEEMAEIFLPFHLPFSLHSNFYYEK